MANSMQILCSMMIFIGVTFGTLTCSPSITNSYKCEVPNDPCYFLPQGQDNLQLFNPDMSTYLKTVPKNGCKATTKLLIGVMTRPCDFEARKFIRENWGSSKLMRKSTKKVFFMGRDQNDEVNSKVAEEIKKYGDILLLDMQESYRNLTLKIFGLLNYAYGYCKNLKCFQKADADTTVNIDGLERFCDNVPDNHLSLYGKAKYHSPVQRNIGDKWYRPYYVYPNNTYPLYSNGPVYMLTGRTIASIMLKTLLEKTDWSRSENLRRMSEDTTFTGEVREKAGIELKDHPGFNWWCCWKNGPKDFVEEARWCDPKSRTLMSLGFENGMMNGRRDEMWNLMQEVNSRRDWCMPEEI